MDNIKKFEDFLDRMQGLLDNAKKQGHIIVRVEDLENAFPELKESEDERIRTGLINGFNECLKNSQYPKDAQKYWHNIKIEDILAWLEKQGENCLVNFDEAEKESEDERIRKTLVAFFTDWHKTRSHCWGISVPKIFAWLEKQGEQKSAKNIVESWKDMRLEVYQQASGNRHEPNYSDDTTKMFSLNDIDEIIEKINEQKPAFDFNVVDWQPSKVDGKIHNIYNSEVEAKFRVGDFVCNKYGKIAHIEDIKVDSYGTLRYYVRWSDGNKSDPMQCFFDDNHLWTIEDAKDGDVLVCNEEILLFKSYSVQGRISLYCWYNGQTNNFHSKEVVDVLMTTRNKICPATKEQQDLLFSKMKDAGYTFDFEKKELKKIEQKPTNEEMKEALRTEYEKGRADAIAEIQKSAWSDEDEEILRTIISDGIRGAEFDMVQVNWLKSLKERMEEQQ